ncbi:MAG: transposase [Oligoflexales bacterium]
MEKIIESIRNPSDYDSRVMKSGKSGGFIQGYNCQAAVDAGSQIILAVQVSSQTNDKGLIRPMIKKVIENLDGKTPKFFTCDNGYYSERDIVWIEKKNIDPYIPPSKKDNGKRFINTVDGVMTITDFMRAKLTSEAGRSIYKKRKTIAEPVFGQPKNVRGFRNFLTRGLKKVNAEWQLISLAHNIGKLHHFGYQP